MYRAGSVIRKNLVRMNVEKKSTAAVLLRSRVLYGVCRFESIAHVVPTHCIIVRALTLSSLT